jgi:3-hydroxyisobutyrate dehydrogenase
MGRPMATALCRAGLVLQVVDVKPEAAEAMREVGAQVASTPADAARRANVVVTMLPEAQHVREVLFGPDGVASSAQPGTLVIDMSTIAAESARSIDRDLRGRGLAFIDAPVSGGPAKAADGRLAIMVGGLPEDLDRGRPVLNAMGDRIYHVGGVGCGQVAKACNNVLVAAIMLADIEALTLGAASGIDPSTLREVILGSTGANWQLENTVPRTLLSDVPAKMFALRLLHKDLGIAEDMGRNSGVPFFITAFVRQLYGLAWSLSGPDPDFTDVADLYRDRGGRRRVLSASVNK